MQLYEAVQCEYYDILQCFWRLWFEQEELSIQWVKVSRCAASDVSVCTVLACGEALETNFEWLLSLGGFHVGTKVRNLICLSRLIKAFRWCFHVFSMQFVCFCQVCLKELNVLLSFNLLGFGFSNGASLSSIMEEIPSHFSDSWTGWPPEDHWTSIRAEIWSWQQNRSPLT